MEGKRAFHTVKKGKKPLPQPLPKGGGVTAGREARKKGRASFQKRKAFVLQNEGHRFRESLSPDPSPKREGGNLSPSSLSPDPSPKREG